jgi:heme o synthase
MTTLVKETQQWPSIWADYFELCKPRVVLLMILTSLVGMCLASDSVPLTPLIFGNLGIALVASAAAAFNHIADQHFDKLMRRTQNRPIVKGKISTKNSLLFASVLCLAGLAILFLLINTLTAVLTFVSSIGYAVFYTLYLKHATPQNIVIGGIAGAAPPLLGWTAVTGHVCPQALLLVLIIYVWTPPHFWALAIYRLEDYAKANIPMLPHTHSVAYTKLNILLYTILLICVSALPYIISMSGLFYFIGAMIINAGFLFHALRLYLRDNRQDAIGTFWYSIYYLGILFVLLLVDHYFLLIHLEKHL